MKSFTMISVTKWKLQSELVPRHGLSSTPTIYEARETRHVRIGHVSDTIPTLPKKSKL